ncbi:DUF4400 domain-containing protein [Paraburkholderia rhizosphaerae]|uniref:Uncharacterized protein DUF4400 n=1 Tax=Paraburkholderia rhizosphaerae TaxID=480658 RepID=A0A4R8LP53_9BURK|nr:DUF4400 domain-containing protein [Paraburkholderia rhizosphaerae]TDY48082.1 uncharacterized protein DUF4400 [Paraburkholderia rhizosphaerae]
MASSSRFVAHVRLWFFFVPLLAVFVMPAIPDRSLFEIPEAESDSVVAALGADRAGEAAERTNSLFRRAFVDSGVMRATVEATRSNGLNDGGVSTFAHTWVRNFWLLVYRVVYRATVMKIWLFGTAVFCVAAFVDGSMRRKIKASAAGFASPLSFHLAGHGILLVFGVAFAVLVAPVPVLAQYWIVVTAVLGVLIWKASSSYQ